MAPLFPTPGYYQRLYKDSFAGSAVFFTLFYFHMSDAITIALMVGKFNPILHVYLMNRPEHWDCADTFVGCRRSFRHYDSKPLAKYCRTNSDGIAYRFDFCRADSLWKSRNDKPCFSSNDRSWSTRVGPNRGMSLI